MPNVARKVEQSMTSPNKESKMSVQGQPGDFWKPPSYDQKYRTGLVVNNSMAGGKVEFVPFRGDYSKKITWYGCGPTVYDAAHMGHARTYLAFDVIRRLMSEYFGYDVFMCMNITDIDDKIIKRSQEQGCDFASLARYWEGEFFEDMRKLNVLLPDVITRVSEYVPEVIAFIGKILENGFAYVSEGGVYFDTQAFRASENHIYGRMEPFSVNDESRVLEGEGELGIASRDKKSPLDFALWKKAKSGEPSWASPWGEGRPGWHIECSAMASAILGFPVDIHSGGIDLRFPHHDNELAQSEACYDKAQWVNYFLHSGHLHIKGSKMSKSLKNFITIRECLASFSPRAFRLLTIMHRWDAPMNYSPDGESMAAAAEIDARFENFFGSIVALLRLSDEDISKTADALKAAKSLDDVQLSGLMAEQRWEQVDHAFHDRITAAETEVHRALSDNFDTPAMLTALRTLVTETNAYVSKSWRRPLLIKAARYIFRMLRICGVTAGSEVTLDYLTTASSSANGPAAGLSPVVMDCLAGFRETTKTAAQELLTVAKTSGDSSIAEVAVNLLKKCDAVRDIELPDAGILLEDTQSGPLWKASTQEEIQKKREWKEAERLRKEEAKVAAREAQEQARIKKQKELEILPHLFIKETRGDQFKEYDDSGLPLVSVDGKPVSKSLRDKMAKLVEKHVSARKAAGLE